MPIAPVVRPVTDSTIRLAVGFPLRPRSGGVVTSSTPISGTPLASTQVTTSRVSTVTGSEPRGGSTSSAIVITGRATHSAAR